ncbi:MAG TPA: type VI secretion IcmF C-terminal domain-containing protein, partial [Noviherbaspirillum sp.]
QQTLEGNGSELAEALRYVDEQMLIGMTDSQKHAIRPILVRPLMQAFAVIVRPAETEIIKIWMAQVVEPFRNTLANKYPFAADAKIEAGSAEIAEVFGPEGRVAKFVTGTMGPLVVRRGDVLTARTWADMGVSLKPAVVEGFPIWIGPLAAAGVAGAGAGELPQTVFQIRPLPAPGLTEYTVEIDGQQLRYRNMQAQWTSMVWPSVSGYRGARISGVTFDGRTVEVLSEPGNFGLKRMIDTAQRRKKDGGVFELSWEKSGVAVSIDLKIVSSPETSGGASAAPQAKGFRGLVLPDSIVGTPSPIAPGVLRTAGDVTPGAGVGATQ